MIDRLAAETAIMKIFKRYNAHYSKSLKSISTSNIGKTYELFTVAHLVEELAGRGYWINYSHRNAPLAFKAAPGAMKTSDPHFELTHPRSSVHFSLFVNVEFETLGSSRQSGVTDLSRRHELDIGIYSCYRNGYPSHDEVALGIECKAVTKLTKQMVRGVLGLRRELSVLSAPSRTRLALASPQPADPPSELRLYSTDGRINNYTQSPAVFGVDLRHVKP